MHNNYDYLFKLLLVGDASVGKSSLLLRFTDSTFSQAFLPTIGVDFKIRTIDVGGYTVKMQIWDTAGQERFRTISSSYYKGAHGIIIVYDITNRQSFAHIEAWANEVKAHGKADVVRLLVGNKTDLLAERQVSNEEGMALAESLGVQFFESSAKNHENVDEAFISLVKEIKQKIQSASGQV